MFIINRYVIHNYLQLIKDFFNHKNKWAEKCIPKHFSDVDYIFEKILFSGLISFWEEDDGEETLRFQFECKDEQFPERMEQARFIYYSLKEAYEYAKMRIESDDFSVLHEDEMIIKDTEMLTRIIKYRKFMWT